MPTRQVTDTRPRGALDEARRYPLSFGTRNRATAHRSSHLGSSGTMKIPTEQSFRSALHHPRVAVVIGRWLGVAVAVCFLTGLFSHLQQTTPGWLVIPSRPASLYRVTQGLHVLTGLVAVPLLLAKLWTVYPKLFAKPPWPPSRQALGTVLERLSILVLVSALALELFIGFVNTLQWYP